MPWPQPPAPGEFCATPYHAAMRAIRADVGRSLLRAEWPAPSNVHAFTTLRGPAGDSAAPFERFNLGLRSGDDAAVVAGNRGMLERALELPSAPRWLRQVHGTHVVRFDATSVVEDGEPEADAAVTDVPGVVLAILTADCLPVVFAARDGSEVAAAHAGWRGLAGGVLEATLATMRTRDVVAWLGPAAGPNRYEVGAEVRDAFVSPCTRDDAAFVATRPGHWHVDLYALARRRLFAAGIGSVTGGDLCTIGDAERFFSHRRDQRTGRMATLAWMAPGA